MNITAIEIEASVNLRDELRQAIEGVEAADARLRIAQDILKKAEHEALKAGEHAGRLKRELDASRQAATEQASRRFAEAIRAGSELRRPWARSKPS